MARSLNKDAVPLSNEIRLVLLIEGLGLGGSERQLYLLLKYLDKTQFECHVIVLNAEFDYFIEPLMDLGVSIWRVPARHKGKLSRIRWITRLLRELKPDILHSWSFHDNTYAGLLGRLAGVPARLGSQRNSYFSSKVQHLGAVYRFLSLYSISHLVVNSKSALREMDEAGYPAGRMTYFPNSVELVSVDRAEEEALDQAHPEIGRGQPLIGTVGNLRKQKNHQMFVEVIDAVMPRFEGLRGVIAGQAVTGQHDVAQGVRAAIESKGLSEKLLLLGSCSQVRALMQRFSVFCLTSDYEGMPNVVLEAMAMGRPVVATRVGDVPELVEQGRSGFLVEPGDVQGFAHSVAHLLSDPALAARFGAAGRERVAEAFGGDCGAQRFAALYLDMLGRTRPRLVAQPG